MIEQPFQAQSVSHRTDKSSLESKRTPRDFPRRLFLYPLPSAAARTAPNGVKERASFCLVFRMVRTSKTDHFFKLAPFWSPLTDLIDFGMAGKLLTSATR